MKYFQLLSCTPYYLTLTYFTKKPNHILNLRYDTVSQILTVGNVHPGKKLIILDDCSGLLTACCINKMGGYGQILHGTSDNKENLNCLNSLSTPCLFVRRIIKSFDLSIFFVHDNVDRNLKRKFCTLKKKPLQKCTKQKLKELLYIGNDALIVATEHHPLTLLKICLPFLKSGSPFVIYSKTIDPLIEIYNWCRRTVSIFLVRLWTSWLRKYQILDGRTHPFVNMSATGI